MERGPRFGSFVAIYGIPETRALISKALAGELAALNQQKVAVQREFEAFKEMATAAARQNREDAARLLEVTRVRVRACVRARRARLLGVLAGAGGMHACVRRACGGVVTGRCTAEPGWRARGDDG